MEMTDAYRRARRSTSVLCGVGLAWSAAQFDLKSLSLGPAGSVDLSDASVPLILACGIVYTLARCTIEFAMQPDDVRRWHLAQIDYKITVFLVRAAVLMLAAAGLYRSVKTVAYIAIAILLLLGGSALLVFAGTFAITPLMIRIRARQGRHSVAARVFEAMAWSELMVVCLIVALLVGLGLAAFRYEPLRSLWTVPPSPAAVTIFVVTAAVVVFSFYLQRIGYRKLFAFQAPFTCTRMADGTIGVSFRKGVPSTEQTEGPSTHSRGTVGDQDH